MTHIVPYLSLTANLIGYNINMKVTVQAPANIAFVKYWGRSDEKLFLPANTNISMTIGGCTTTTTIETYSGNKDLVEIKSQGKNYSEILPDSIKSKNIFDQIARIRKLAKSNLYVKVKSENSFPADAGIASSASGFCALTGALLLTFGLHKIFEDKKEFSRQVRLCGSGSAVRSVYGGFVEMTAGNNHKSSYARQIADEKHWDLVDIVAIINADKKKISSSQGHETAKTSPYFKARVADANKRAKIVRRAILDKNFHKLGLEIEKDSFSMHAVMMTQNPPAIYWEPGSISVIKQIQKMREEEGLLVYTTFDAGANAHVICLKKDAKKIQEKLLSNKNIKNIIYNEPAPGAKQINNHLF